MPLPPNGKSILMTPDPFHTPGYGGFCPQFKYQIGETFGRTTSRLLKNDAVASSGKLVLADLSKPRPSSEPTHSKSNLLKNRTQSWGDQKLLEKMVPGYTGFIPRSQHYFGNRYAINCRSAITDFEFDHRLHNEKLQDLKLTAELQQGKVLDKDGKPMPAIRSRYFTPLTAVAKEPKPYISANSFQHSKSPYYMDNDNPNKCFMSGYTGFVPRSRGQLGMGYPIITHQGLNEFTNDLKNMKAAMSRDVNLKREAPKATNTKPIYPVESGLVPHYTGHIPGQKFRYGETFGHSTENALTQPPPRELIASI